MHTHLLLRYGELFLKGKNRSLFESKLVGNIKAITGVSNVHRIQGRLVVHFFPEHLTLRRVFGLTSYSPAVRMDKDVEQIKQTALKLLSGTPGTFRVETRRADKSFPLTSIQLNTTLGQHLEEKTSLQFSSDKPNTVLGVEINQDGAYLFTERINCHGGLPTGVEGRVNLLLEDEASILAGLLMMKRGCGLTLINPGKRDSSLLEKYSPFRIKNIEHADPGVPLVSSQMFSHYAQYSHPVVFRPLIAYSKDEIAAQLQQFIPTDIIN